MKVNFSKINATIVLSTLMAASVFIQTESRADLPATSNSGAPSCFQISPERYGHIEWAMKRTKPEARIDALQKLNVGPDELEKFLAVRKEAKARAEGKTSTNPKHYIKYGPRQIETIIHLRPNLVSTPRFICGDNEGIELMAYEEFLGGAAARVVAGGSSKAEDQDLWLDSYRLSLLDKLSGDGVADADIDEKGQSSNPTIP
jgi:hypothetical protein